MATLASSNLSAQQVSIEIKAPGQNEIVAHRYLVSGGTQGPSDIWIVVHPLESGGYWVQSKADVSNGLWSSLVYFGRDVQNNSGAGFLVKAFGNPKAPLREGMRLHDWPAAQVESNLVVVSRR